MSADTECTTEDQEQVGAFVPALRTHIASLKNSNTSNAAEEKSLLQRRKNLEKVRRQFVFSFPANGERKEGGQRPPLLALAWPSLPPRISR